MPHPGLHHTISLPCRGRPAVLPPIAPLSSIAAAAVHRDLYAAHHDRDCAAAAVGCPPRSYQPSPSPTATPAGAHRRRRRRHPSIATLSIDCISVYCATTIPHLMPPPIRCCPIAPLVRVLVGWQRRGEERRAVVTAAVGVPAV